MVKSEILLRLTSLVSRVRDVGRMTAPFGWELTDIERELTEIEKNLAEAIDSFMAKRYQHHNYGKQEVTSDKVVQRIARSYHHSLNEPDSPSPKRGGSTKEN